MLSHKNKDEIRSPVGFPPIKHLLKKKTNLLCLFSSTMVLVSTFMKEN